MDNLLTFADRQSFRDWLGKYGKESEGVWLLFSKRREFVTLSAGDALEEALCHGWIDGQIQSIDEACYKKYFARRLPKSKWSAKNIKLAEVLLEKGMMTPAGIEAIERARENGSLKNTSPVEMIGEQVSLFKKVIQPFEPAFTNLLAMSPSVQRTYARFYSDAKTDKTRESRLEKIVDRLNRNLKPM